MSTKSNDDDTSIGSTEMRALRRIAEPVAPQLLPQAEELWASRYRVVEAVGRGGMGDVFLARDVLLDRLVALKVLRTTSEESFVDERRLLREARAAARAEHERVARIYDVGTWRGQSYIAMEYVRGETLRVWMKTHRPSTSDVTTILQQLFEGLQALHGRGLVHRDLKPENIMVTPEGTLRILDLGVARRVAIPGTADGANDGASLSIGFGVGTPGYMAPEQWRQIDIDARADIFAVGVIAYELIVGRAPFRGSTNPEVRDRTLHGDIAFDDDCWARTPLELKSAIQIALARDREHRFSNVASMVTALSPLIPPSVPPLPAPRTIAGHTPRDDRPARESLAASAFGLSIRVLAKKRPAWLVIGGIVGVAVGLSAVLRNGKSVFLPATPGMVRFAGASYTMGLDAVELEAECRTFARGCPPEAKNETPPRQITVAPFELDVREVTNEEFAIFLTRIGSLTVVTDDYEDHYPRFVRYIPRPGEDYLLYDLYPSLAGLQRSETQSFSARSGFERLPVTLVTWLAAHLYCKGAGKRLPTEGEWQLAARGVEGRPYPWGREEPRCQGVHIPSNKDLVLQNADQCENGRLVPFPVMSAVQDVTPQGIYDMAGNVFEWVDDDALLHSESVTDATRASVEKSGINRGGAYDASFGARTTARAFWLASAPAYNVGFRCAKSIISR